MIEMDFRLDRDVQHQTRTKHPGENNTHDGVALNAAVIVEVSGRHRAEQTGDKRANCQRDARNPRQDNPWENRMTHGIAHKRPAFEY